jgi:hypothetical protein
LTPILDFKPAKSFEVNNDPSTVSQIVLYRVVANAQRKGRGLARLCKWLATAHRYFEVYVIPPANEEIVSMRKSIIGGGGRFNG